MRAFLYLFEVFSCISNSLQEVHLSDDITIGTTRLRSYEDTDKYRPYDHKQDNSQYLSSDDCQYVHECMETGSEEESDDAPEYQEK